MKTFSPKPGGPSQSIQSLEAILDRLQYCNTDKYLEVNAVTHNVGYTGDEILEIQRLAWLLIEEIDAMPYPVYPHAR